MKSPMLNIDSVVVAIAPTQWYISPDELVPIISVIVLFISSLF